MDTNIWNNEELIKTLIGGGLVVMPTDTLYGVVCRALDVRAVDMLHELRKKKSGKPCIILVANSDELEKFSVALSDEQKNEIEKNWPGPVSIILDCEDDNFDYLHRGTKTLAFRMPANESLRELLKQTGPLIAPSANTEGEPPAKNITEAKAYFGDQVDFYLDGGEVNGNPSKIIKLAKDGIVSVIRE